MEQQINNFLNVIISTVKKGETDFIITNEMLETIGIYIFEDLLLQNITRDIEGFEVNFFAVKNIVIKKEFRSKKILSKLLDVLEKNSIPIFIDDIINHKLFSFLYMRGYANYKYNSSYGWKKCMYKTY